MLTTKRKPVTVGEILVEEFMQPLELTQAALAEAMGVQRKHVNELCNNRRNVTAATALILARVFGNSPDFWQLSNSTRGSIFIPGGRIFSRGSGSFSFGSSNPNVNLIGTIDKTNNVIFIEHNGGNSLELTTVVIITIDSDNYQRKASDGLIDKNYETNGTSGKSLNLILMRST